MRLAEDLSLRNHSQTEAFAYGINTIARTEIAGITQDRKQRNLVIIITCPMRPCAAYAHAPHAPMRMADSSNAYVFAAYSGNGQLCCNALQSRCGIIIIVSRNKLNAMFCPMIDTF